MNNQNKKLSRNRKRRIVRKIKMDDEMRLLLYKNKKESKKKEKNIIKIRELETDLVKIKYANNPNKLQSALKELNKIQVVNKNLHEIKQEIIKDYVGEVELVGSLKVGDQIRQTHIRCRNVTDYEAYINSIDEGYDAEDAIFNGYIYKNNTPQFNEINRNQYGNGCDFKQEIIEYRGDNCFVPTKGYYFVKCLIS